MIAHKIAFLSADVELPNRVRELFPEEIASGRFKVLQVESRDVLTLQEKQDAYRMGRQIEQEGFEAAITRGGVFADLEEMLHIPVFSMEFNTLDILLSIQKATIYREKILLLLWKGTYCDEMAWRELLNTPVVVERFSNAEDITNIIKRYRDQGEGFTVVSGGIGCLIAAEYEMDHVLLSCSKESIHDMVYHVDATLERYQTERYENELLQTILASSHDATVVVDSAGEVILFNRLAEQLLNIPAKRVMRKPLAEVLPELKFMLQAPTPKQSERTEIRQFNGITIAANISPLQTERMSLGTVCLFQDITRLQKLEKKIRFEISKKGLTAHHTLDSIITQSANMRQVIHRARIAAGSDRTIILFGESGTGKELLAQGIHNASRRREFPFVAVNCAALSESLLESELFGYEDGAFTGARKGGKQGLFELAHGGTIFLDEINSISITLQTKLLRVLEEKEVMHIGSDYVIPLDVRIIAAANESLREMVSCGKFRKDLFYRLNTLELFIPPLRERMDDVLPLFQAYLKREAPNGQEFVVSEAVADELRHYTWPGNVRELRNAVQRFILFGNLELDPEEKYVPTAFERRGILNLKDIELYVEEKVVQTLLRSGMTKTQVADILGISRSALWKKLNPPADPEE